MQTPPGPPPPPHPALVQAHAPPRYNPWAIVSVAFGASTILGTWCFGGLVAIITGHVARHQIKRTGEQGANLALIGLIAGYASIGITLVLVLAYVAFIVFFITFATLHATPSPSPSPQ